MNQTTRILSISTLIFLVSLTGCQSIDQPKGTSKGYTSFRLIETGPVGDDRFAEPSQERDIIAQDAIIQAFESAGLSYNQDQAELMVSYLMIRQDNVSTLALPKYYGMDYSDIQSYAHKKGVVKGSQYERFEKGAIVVDVIDLAKNKLIYRNYAVRDIMGIDNPEQAEPLIRSAVSEAVSGFLQ